MEVVQQMFDQSNALQCVQVMLCTDDVTCRATFTCSSTGSVEVMFVDANYMDWIAHVH